MTLVEFLNAVGQQGAAQDDDVMVQVGEEFLHITGVIFDPDAEERTVVITIE